jgi:hypothetical protein
VTFYENLQNREETKKKKRKENRQPQYGETGKHDKWKHVIPSSPGLHTREHV